MDGDYLTRASLRWRGRPILGEGKYACHLCNGIIRLVAPEVEARQLHEQPCNPAEKCKGKHPVYDLDRMRMPEGQYNLRVTADTIERD